MPRPSHNAYAYAFGDVPAVPSELRLPSVKAEHFTPEYLASIIELRDGVMHWKRRGAKWFDPLYADKPVSLRANRDGYHTVRICKRDVAAHRVVWALHHGVWPTGYIDHINRDRTDNRIENLRDVSMVVNNLNTVRSKTGGGGVHLNRHGTWTAQIRRDGRLWHLGSFQTREDALAVRRAAEILLYGSELEWAGGGKFIAGGVGDRAVAARLSSNGHVRTHDGSGK